jgi:REP element-mobilizing transposase RayT
MESLKLFQQTEKNHEHKMKDHYQPLRPDTFYHIFNRGNNKENIFCNQRNYHYFMDKYEKVLSPYLETYAFCLLPNHFHVLVKIKSAEEIRNVVKLSSRSDSIAPSDGIAQYVIFLFTASCPSD